MKEELNAMYKQLQQLKEENERLGYAKDDSFWKRLKMFVTDVQTGGCCAGEEEKEMILNVCDKILTPQNPIR